MWLWRISEWTDLDGAGGLILGGRWHSKGQPIVYLAESSALAILEKLVQQSRTSLPAPYQLLQVRAADALTISDWPSSGDHTDKTRTVGWGDAFLRDRQHALARVPSAIAPHSWNYLLNPAHPAAKQVKVFAAGRWPWDTRLFDRD